jgi:hypothetical protein
MMNPFELTMPECLENVARIRELALAADEIFFRHSRGCVQLFV